MQGVAPGAEPLLMHLCNRKWGPAAHSSKANKQARLVERKVCFISDACNHVGSGGGRKPIQRPTLPTDNQWARAFIGGGRGPHAETAQEALTVILNLVISGLTSIILIVLSTVSLQFQGWFVSISLRPILGIVAAYVMATVWSSCG